MAAKGSPCACTSRWSCLEGLANVALPSHGTARSRFRSSRRKPPRPQHPRDLCRIADRRHHAPDPTALRAHQHLDPECAQHVAESSADQASAGGRWTTVLATPAAATPPTSTAAEHHVARRQHAELAATPATAAPLAASATRRPRRSRPHRPHRSRRPWPTRAKPRRQFPREHSCRMPDSPSSSTRLGTTFSRRPDNGDSIPGHVTRCFPASEAARTDAPSKERSVAVRQRRRSRPVTVRVEADDH